MSQTQPQRRFPVLVLPGIDGTAPIRQPLMEALSRRGPAELVVYPHDPLAGYGDLAHLAVSLAPEGPVHLMGESFGGPLAIEVARRLGPRAVSLTLAVTFLRFHYAEALRGVAQVSRAEWLPDLVIESVNLGRWATPGLRDKVRWTVRQVPPAVLEARAREALRIDRRAAFAALTCPALYLGARSDRLFPARYRQEALSLRPDLRVEVINAPHMLLETHTEQAVALVEHFLADTETLYSLTSA